MKNLSNWLRKKKTVHSCTPLTAFHN
uniref:Uncharacterized protein n=1 Tax=Rhizophora mucronata TaxID=61149 RepID=A0A2P2R1T5_RHIMU